MQLTTHQLFDLFLPLSSWQDRYRQIIQLAKILPDFPEQERVANNQIEGCENRVWLSYTIDNEQIFTFYGDSEGRIVKGLLVILLILASNKTADEVERTDFLAILRQLNIIEELSESRQFGIQNIIKRIKQVASNNK